MTNGNIRLNYPLSVWDKNWNKIINIKGGDIMVSDVRKMEAENKNVNITCTVQWCRPALSIPIYQCATEPKAENEARIWLHFLSNLHILQRRKQTFGPNQGLFSLARLYQTIHFFQTEKRARGTIIVLRFWRGYQTNLPLWWRKPFQQQCICHFRSKQTLSLHEQQLSWLATQPARLLFTQIDRASGTSYQDFLLQAKSILDSHSTKYIDHISNYIADSRLVKTELFKNIEATDANLYLYDAPYNSLTVGGILFPKGRNRLESNALETALDSVLWQSFETDSLLLHSLKDYERNIGVLRSRPHPNWRIYSIIRKILTVWALRYR